MLTTRLPFIVSIVLAAVSLVIALWKGEGMMIGISAVALFISVPAMIYCANGVSLHSLLASSVVLVCTVVIVTVASVESMVDDIVSRDTWSYVAALIHCAAILPLIISFYFTITAASGASYNWVLASGFAMFIGMGMLLPGHAVVFFTQRSKIDDVVTKTDAIAGLLVGLIIFTVFAIILCCVLRKKRCLITKNGLEAMK